MDCLDYEGETSCSETSTKNYHSKLRKMAKDRRSQNQRSKNNGYSRINSATELNGAIKQKNTFVSHCMNITTKKNSFLNFISFCAPPFMDTAPILNTVRSLFTAGLRSRIFGCKSNRRKTSTIYIF